MSGAACNYPDVRCGFWKVELFYALLGVMATPANVLTAFYPLPYLEANFDNADRAADGASWPILPNSTGSSDRSHLSAWCAEDRGTILEEG